MTLTALSLFAQFSAMYGSAWNAFASNSEDDFSLKNFVYDQTRGAYVATDTKDGEHVFRVYQDKIVAILSPAVNLVFVDGTPVQIS